jgi:hypothetical protein
MLKNEFENKFDVKCENFIEKNVILITIKMDENNGYHREKSSKLSIKEFKLILPVLKSIDSNEFESVGDYKIDDYEVPFEVEDLWDKICPYNEYGGSDLCITDLKFIDENSVSYIIKL